MAPSDDPTEGIAMKYVKDMRGRVVQAPTYRPSGDQNPEGRAAKRRRKQLERKNPPAEVQHAADSSKPPEAVSQDIAPTCWPRP